MKSRKNITNMLVWLPALLLTLSAAAKFAGATVIVNNLTKAGIIPYFPLPALGFLELTCVALYLIPATWRIGFFLLCGYLGGAGAIEISQHLPPTAFILLTLVWIGVFLKDKSIFLREVTRSFARAGN
ncbi:hypothetical protein QWZ08_23365 [Ferruginibacter paludis]|uniref:hypothetical protein n=1 Tax=Ferruginibacter paludis TaxID=1310417 RepID=UPI0025B410F0|nr:hypothetical protein [Ferruginibacter paludis]MDN3658604.1 hypothetical protein [Ferruginibacter paludis]